MAVLAVLLVPRILPVGYVIKGTALIAFAVIGISLVVLTGWAGQISLGQMAIVGIGAAVSATFTSRWSIDLNLALIVGGVVGGLAAFAVGVPALRLRGLYLAVTTFALALATERWLLNSTYFDWFPAPDERFERPPLFGRIDVESPTAFYFYSVAVLAVVYVAVRGIRRSRTGRVIIAMRENERGAQAYAVPVVRAKLTAFVISGVVAGVAGALLVHGNRSFTGTQFGVGASFEVFTSAVIGGLGSLGGALLGALYLRGTRWFITSPEWQLLSTGVGVLVVLLILPGGLGSLWVKLRDVAVRLLTRRRSGVGAGTRRGGQIRPETEAAQMGSARRAPEPEPVASAHEPVQRRRAPPDDVAGHRVRRGVGLPAGRAVRAERRRRARPHGVRHPPAEHPRRVRSRHDDRARRSSPCPRSLHSPCRCRSPSSPIGRGACRWPSPVRWSGGSSAG